MSLAGFGVVEGNYDMKGAMAGKGRSLKIGGVYYSSFEAVNVNKGDEVEFSYEEKVNGQYTNRNIVKGSLSVTGGGTAPVATTAPTQAPKKTYAPKASVGDDERQKLIVAQNSLTNATNLVVAYKEELGLGKKTADITSTVKEIASVFAKAVTAGDFYKEEAFDDELPH